MKDFAFGQLDFFSFDDGERDSEFYQFWGYDPWSRGRIGSAVEGQDLFWHSFAATTTESLCWFPSWQRWCNWCRLEGCVIVLNDSGHAETSWTWVSFSWRVQNFVISPCLKDERKPGLTTSNKTSKFDQNGFSNVFRIQAKFHGCCFLHVLKLFTLSLFAIIASSIASVQTC